MHLHREPRSRGRVGSPRGLGCSCLVMNARNLVAAGVRPPLTWDEDTGHLGFLSCPLEGQHGRPCHLPHGDEMCHHPRSWQSLSSGHVGSRVRVRGGLPPRDPQATCMWPFPTAPCEPASKVLTPQERDWGDSALAPTETDMGVKGAQKYDPRLGAAPGFPRTTVRIATNIYKELTRPCSEPLLYTASFYPIGPILQMRRLRPCPLAPVSGARWCSGLLVSFLVLCSQALRGSGDFHFATVCDTIAVFCWLGGF